MFYPRGFLFRPQVYSGPGRLTMASTAINARTDSLRKAICVGVFYTVQS